MMKSVTYRPTHSKQEIKAEMIEGLCRVRNDHHAELLVQAEPHGSLLKLNVMKNDSLLNDDLLLVAAEYILGHNTELEEIEIHGFNPDKKSAYLLQKHFLNNDGVILFARHQFFQLKGIWHVDRDHTPSLETWTVTKDRVHPVRNNIQSGTLYSRYVPAIEKTLSFRIIDTHRDLDTFHEWHNQPRVSNFWELALPKVELLTYMENGLKDTHTLPMILEADGKPVGYFEMYWCPEDRLAPYYSNVEAFDRGFHFLIGDPEFLGLKNTDSALKSLAHFLFIDDIRTSKIMAEPRADNAKVLKYVESIEAWKKLYEFDFPHKRAAMLECKRQIYFMGKNL